ncbi:MAG: hypothetical protein UT34_C0002G0104 [candidate division WS6 bacterium GW2011_GWF2_39_15]|uniref:DUF11 domain-containing protein n=1 Tax=candidate division WS6 bacterium GW2011_GWF2_39_15 TaxID=1619100 RepID=A0A0G0QVF1_9BACT|nr:MAG: hypothetical protein UT34_C0002G0104 [candidate division WS6 bacterium GW2011_GWF2_39_15]
MEPSGKNSKALIRVVLIITAILGLVSIGTAYYFYQIKDVSPTDTSAAEGCGCYYVLSQESLNSCANATPEDAFEFRAGTKNSNGVCSVTCDERTAADIKSSTQTPTLLLCKQDSFTANPGCVDLSVENADGDRLPEGVTPSEEVTLKATFVAPTSVTPQNGDYYKGFSFTINGEKVDIAKANAQVTGSGSDKTYTISTQFSDYKNAEKVTVQAFGTTVTNSEMTSQACLRTISVEQPKVASCSNMSMNLTDDNKPKVSDISMDVNSVSEVSSLAIEFQVGTESTKITTKDITSKYIDGTIILDQAFLYDTDNFTSTKSFSLLDTEITKYDVTATVLVNGEKVDSTACAASESLPSTTPSEEEPTTGEEEEPTPTDEEPTNTDTSSFVTTKTASKQCVERTSPNNTIKYTIEVENIDTAYEDITSIKDKLPLGFSYTAGSSEINGAAVADDDFVTVTTVGSTQEIVWQTENGWSVKDNDSLTIVFSATANSTALSGSNLNEVVVTPVNTPTDATKLRSQVDVEVAQSCTAPETALFDSNVAKAVLGLLVIVLATAFYYSQSGDRLTEKILTSGIYKSVYKSLRFTGLKLTEPRKYFEEKAIYSLEKRRGDKGDK